MRVSRRRGRTNGPERQRQLRHFESSIDFLFSGRKLSTGSDTPRLPAQRTPATRTGRRRPLRIASAIGGWHDLPQEGAAMQDAVNWWSVLDDVPVEVVRCRWGITPNQQSEIREIRGSPARADPYV